MAFTSLLRQRAVPLAGLTGALALYPKSFTYADAPPLDLAREIRTRKPIYDAPSQPSIRAIAATTPPAPPAGLALPASSSDLLTTTSASPSSASDSPSSSPRRSSSPTTRLAAQIRQTRLLAHHYSTVLESQLNSTLSQIFQLEHSFTSTVQSLAPPKESNERLLPSSIYVLVAGLGGNILTRNRNILLRATVPLAAGLVTANWVLPATMGRVSEVVWGWEQRWPVLAHNHERVQEGVTRFWETGKAHSLMGLEMVKERVGGVREGVEDWVRKGR